MGKTFMTKQFILIQNYTKKLGQSEDYTNGCLLDYDHIKNHYRLITVDSSRKK